MGTFYNIQHPPFRVQKFSWSIPVHSHIVPGCCRSSQVVSKWPAKPKMYTIQPFPGNVLNTALESYDGDSCVSPMCMELAR